ncbi:hypothetical protein KJ966_23905 [bacterium]|nr:hypothetical protein [bacterium]
MITKSKISITIDKHLLEDIENAANVYKMAKSKLVQEALKLWLKIKTEEQMAKGYEEEAKKDSELAELAFNAQNEVVNG